jgi:hypothetical protein
MPERFVFLQPELFPFLFSVTFIMGVARIVDSKGRFMGAHMKVHLLYMNCRLYVIFEFTVSGKVILRVSSTVGCTHVLYCMCTVGPEERFSH